MKKTGILTFHNADNYGALLQCFAMQEHLNKTTKAEVINYFPDYFYEKYRVYTPLISTYKKLKNLNFSLPLLRSIKSYSKNIYFFSRRNKRQAFQKFRKKYLSLTKMCKNQEEFIEIAKDFNCISVGSDQVWSKRITGGIYDSVFFLNGIDEKIIKMSYAASSGGTIPLEDEKEVCNLLKDFNKISAREVDLADQLTDLTGRSCKHVMDPVFLLNKEEWESKLIGNNPFKNDGFIFTYNVSSESTAPEYFKLVDELSKKTGLKVYEVAAKRHTKSKGKVFKNAGPKEFMQLLSASDIIFTTSFHATALAIILRKQFYVFLPSNAKRVTSLLDKLNLSDRLIYPGSSFPEGKIDYKNIDSLEEDLIKDSKDFIEITK